MYKCERCDATFQSEGKLKRHLHSNKIPCDFFCKNCGVKKASIMQYKRHLEKSCEIQAVVVDVVENVVENVVEDVVENVVDKQPAQNPQIINFSGIITIEKEQELLLPLYSLTLCRMFIQFLQPNKPNNMKGLLLNIVQLFHSNQNNPEHLNIIEKTDDSVRCMVYNGNKFVTDHFSKSMRTKRVLQLLLQTIDNFIQLNNIIIQQMIKPFCENVFIPFICEQYVNSTFSDEMQVYWKNNRQLLEAIDYKQYPSINDIVLTEDIIDEQFADYQERERAIMNILQQYLKKKVEQQQRLRQQQRQRQHHRQLLNQTFNIE